MGCEIYGSKISERKNSKKVTVGYAVMSHGPCDLNPTKAKIIMMQYYSGGYNIEADGRISLSI